jgi:hypothetical protein
MDEFTASQVSGTIPDLKIRLNRSRYNDKYTSEVDFITSFLTISSPDALSFLISLYILKFHEFSGKLSENILNSSTSSWSRAEFRFLDNSYNIAI